MINFWRSLDLTLINCEIELNLSWSKDWIISEILNNTEIAANSTCNQTVAHLLLEQKTRGTLKTRATFQINSAKLYIPVVTLSINNNINLLRNIKQGLKRTVSWNKYRSEIKT